MSSTVNTPQQILSTSNNIQNSDRSRGQNRNQQNRDSSRSRSRSRDRNRNKQNESPIKSLNDENGVSDDTKSAPADLFVSHKSLAATYQQSEHPNHDTTNTIKRTNNTKTTSCVVSTFYRRAIPIFSSGDSGIYEEIPPVCIDNIDIVIRWFPNGHDSTSNQSSLGIIIANKAHLLHRIKWDEEAFDIKVQLGPYKETVTFRLGEFYAKTIVFRSLGFGLDLYQKHKNMALDISSKIKYVKCDRVKPVNHGPKLYQLNKKFGAIRLYSSNSDCYKVGDDIYIYGKGNKENSNNSNNNNDTFGIECSDDFVRIERSTLASLGITFENMINNNFMNSEEIIINAPMQQIDCLVWFACTAELHPLSDPMWFALMGQYLCDQYLIKKALNMCFWTLTPQRLPKICDFYSTFQVKFNDGLQLLALYIRDNANVLRGITDKETG
eukprot:434148_1